MPELTFGRPKSYPKIVTPEIEAKREVERNVVRKQLSPAYVEIYNKAIVTASDEDLKLMSTASAKIIHEMDPDVPEIMIQNGIILAKAEFGIRQNNPAR
jgi:hypothetical protein